MSSMAEGRGQRAGGRGQRAEGKGLLAGYVSRSIGPSSPGYSYINSWNPHNNNRKSKSRVGNAHSAYLTLSASL
jgi:hypothetical protein